MIQWQWAAFDELSAQELYQILRLRQQVFVVEQNCAYDDIDNLDECAWHLIAWDVDNTGLRTICAYLRVFGPKVKFIETSIGRVIVSEQSRGIGLGQTLMRKAISLTGEQYPKASIRISAQYYLESFYSEFGFVSVSEPYDEDGISHIEMLRA